MGANITPYICDVRDEQRVHEGVIQEIINRYGNMDILLNKAGFWRMWKPFVETTSDEWKKRLNVNGLVLLYFTHAVLPNMIENAYGRIINIGSVAGVYGIANMADYSMAQGAVSLFTKVRAKEVVF